MIRFYNAGDRESILAFAQQLENKSLRQLYSDNSVRLGLVIKTKPTDKGGFGKLVEFVHFGITPNQRPEPDLFAAGVEIKTNPLEIVAGRMGSAERLSLGMIDYNSFRDADNCDLEKSSFWKKNSCLLILFFFPSDKEIHDNRFEMIGSWEFPPTDLKIIRDDFDKIVATIKNPGAHHLSGRDTLYLEAATKGGYDKTQPYFEEKARSRAFALKQRYLRFIIDKWQKRKLFAEPVVQSLSEYQTGQTFEDLVISRFAPFYGLTERQIADRLGIVLSTAKHSRNILARRILGVRTHRVEEFEKANVEMKTVCLGASDKPLQEMSFKQIRYSELAEQSWEESDFFEVLSRRFLFVVFRQITKGVNRLEKAFFWSMPEGDLEAVRDVWQDTQEKILRNDYQHFIRISDNNIAHVRPKGVNRKGGDKMLTPHGTTEEKTCFWLNATYLTEIMRNG